VIAVGQRLDGVKLGVQAHCSGHAIAVTHQKHRVGRIVGRRIRILAGAQQLRPEIAGPRLGAVGIGLEACAPRGGNHPFRKVQRDLVGIGGYDIALCRRDAEIFGGGIFRNLTDCGRCFQKRSLYKQSIFSAIGVGRNRECNDARNHT